MKLLKAWIVTYGGWAEVRHAKTKGKAKSIVLGYTGLYRECYTDLWVRRLPGCDDKPLTFENLANAGFIPEDIDGEPDIKFVSACGCEICRGAK